MEANNATDYNGLPEDVKRWYNQFAPNAEDLQLPLALRLITSIVSHSLCKRYGSRFYFGAANGGPVRDAGCLATLMRELPFIQPSPTSNPDIL